MVNFDVPPDLTTYNLLLASIVNSQSYEAYSNIYRHMVSKGIHPDAVTYTRMIAACARNPAKCDELFNEMVKAKIEPTADVFHAMVTSHTRYNRASAASRCVELFQV